MYYRLEGHYALDHRGRAREPLCFGEVVAYRSYGEACLNNTHPNGLWVAAAAESQEELVRQLRAMGWTRSADTPSVWREPTLPCSGATANEGVGHD